MSGNAVMKVRRTHDGSWEPRFVVTNAGHHDVGPIGKGLRGGGLANVRSRIASGPPHAYVESRVMTLITDGTQ